MQTAINKKSKARHENDAEAPPHTPVTARAAHAPVGKQVAKPAPHTPSTNSARKQPQGEPTVDDSEASGGEEDHKATVRTAVSRAPAPCPPIR